MRARIPQPVEETLRNRVGDCKDHSLLLFQLLRHQGFDAQLVLVSSRERVTPEFPSLDQFDHMIVRCGDCGPLEWLDATAEEGNPLAGPPMFLGGRNALVLDEEGSRLERISAYPADAHRATIERRAAIGSDGSVEIDETLEVAGYPAQWLRSVLKGSERQSWPQLLAGEYLGGAEAVQVRSVDALSQNLEPLRIAIHYRVPRRFSGNGAALSGRLPSYWESILLEPQRWEDRRTPFRIEFPLQVTSRVEIRPPDGAQLASNAADATERGRFARWSHSSAGDEDAVVVEARIERETGRFDAEVYGAYVREMEEAIDVLRTPIEVLPSGP